MWKKNTTSAMAGAHPAPKDTDFHSPFLSQLAPAASQHLLPASLLHGLSPETAAQHLVSAVVQPSTSQPAIRGHAYRGVTAIPSAPEDKRWRATINNNGKTIDIGGFRTEVEAATAYDEAARRLHGERARLNFPSSGERSSMGRSQYRGISWQVS